MDSLKDHPALIGRSVAREWRKQRNQRLEILRGYERNYPRYCQIWPRRCEKARRLKEPLPERPVHPSEYALRWCRGVLYPICYSNGSLQPNHPLYRK